MGSTPTAAVAMRVAGVTECRPGNYVFHDASQVALGTCDARGLRAHDRGDGRERAGTRPRGRRRGLEDAVERPAAAEAGTGHGRILGRASYVEKLSEEHGVIAVAEGEAFRVGERVRILPNHACVVANLHDRLVGVSQDKVEAVLQVAARGRVR